MNRDIEFRGMTVETKQWVFGYYCQLEGKDYIVGTHNTDLDNAELRVFDSAYDEGTIGFVEVVRESVGQWTGRSSKNGEKIYEGDDVCGIWSRDNSEWHGRVLWAAERGGFVVQCGSITRWINQVERVIGNVHEYPELLEEK